jgi:molybdate transport system substrate-binding protein
VRLVAVAVVVLVVAACTGDDGGDRTDLLVLGASSLTAAFTEIEAAFEGANPDIDVVLTFDSSSTLADQVAEGGPAGVLATADEATMAIAVDSGEVAGDPVLFAANTGVLAHPVGNDTVTTPEGLEDDSVLLAVCAPEVPCGIVARSLFEALGIDPQIDSDEENVGAVLSKLEADEIDAGVIYATDDLASDAVEAVPLPDDVVVTTDYPIVAVEDSDAAEAFAAFVAGAEGQAILESTGFLSP